MSYIPKKTIIYGGAFNPPTLAHQAILQGCIDYAQVQGADVWLLPSADRKDKAIKVNRDRRLVLCEALLKDIEHRTVTVVVSTIELDRGIETETYRTVRELAALYPEREFQWVFGTDSIASMPSWTRGDWMLRHLSLLITEREGSPYVSPGKNARLLGVNTGGISSTEVRRRMSAGEDYDDLVSPTVKTLLR